MKFSFNRFIDEERLERSMLSLAAQLGLENIAEKIEPLPETRPIHKEEKSYDDKPYSQLT